MKRFLAMMLLTSLPLAHAELYDGPNNPRNFNRIAGMNLVLQFDSLPSSGDLADDRMGWSETYWPSNKGAIAYRWNSPNPQPFTYHLNSPEELVNMSKEELSQLSPSELFDIANDDYNYTLTKFTFAHHKKNDLWWEGICHGWAQAASNYPEPAPVIVRNRLGIKVPFGSSDVKALLAMHEAYNFKGQTSGFVGVRCKAIGKVEGEGDERDRITTYPTEAEANSPACKDVNAGAFHVVISNMLGILGKGFVADIDRFNDVWNQPITNYKSSVVAEEEVTPEQRAMGVARRLRVNLTMTYGEELKFYTPELAAAGHQNFVSKLPVTLTPHQKFLSRDYVYIVELNGRGDVIGGDWVTSTRPDFMWMFARAKQFKSLPAPMAGLAKIYKPIKR